MAELCAVNAVLFKADVASASVTTKKKKDDKDTGKAAVRARYLMEKYGTRWRAKVATGVWQFSLVE